MKIFLNVILLSLMVSPLIAANETETVSIKSEPIIWHFSNNFNESKLIKSDFTDTEIKILSNYTEIERTAVNFIFDEEKMKSNATAEEYMDSTFRVGTYSSALGATTYSVQIANAQGLSSILKIGSRVFIVTGTFAIGYTVGKEILALDRKYNSGSFKIALGQLIGGTIEYYSQEDAGEKFLKFYKDEAIQIWNNLNEIKDSLLAE